jgi:hypothetical protein
MADENDPVQSPSDLDKALSAAYLRYLGMSQKEAASRVGIGERTLRRWEDCSWWAEVKAEAAERWLGGLMEDARAGLKDGVRGDGHLALKVLERLDDRLAPPKLRTELTGRDGGPIQHEDVTDTRDKIAKKLDAVGGRIGALASNGKDSPNGNGAHG